MRAAYATALLCLCGLSCTTGILPADERPPAATPRGLSEHVPVYELEVDSADFAQLYARFEDTLEIRATVSVWRGGARVAEDLGTAIKLKGNASRSLPLKPIGIRFDERQDNRGGRLLAVPTVRPDHDLARVRALRLRNGGSDFDAGLVKDLAYARMLALSDLDVDLVYGEPAATFVNGDFLGVHNLRSETSPRAVADLLDVRKSRLRMIEVDVDAGWELKEGPQAYWDELADAIARGNLALVDERVDDTSLIDFVIGGSLFAIPDWLYHNVRMYAPEDDDVRFLLFDMDRACTGDVDQGLLEFVLARESRVRDLFALMLTDPEFEREFWERYGEVLAGGALAPAVLEEQFAALAAVAGPVIAYQTEAYGVPASRPEWLVTLQHYVDAYAYRYRLAEDEVAERLGR